MSKTKFDIAVNIDLAKEIMSTKIYESDASAFREQYVNALSHGCTAYHEKYGYTDDVFVRVVFDYGHRKVTIHDNGMGMSEKTFKEIFMAFGYSTVKKDQINSRSGMFGLGAISFFRIADACIVESWHRETDEHFAYITKGTDVTEYVGNKQLESYGTITEIFLNDSVNIMKLIDKTKSIANNYPVRSVIEVINTEGGDEISTYREINDSYEEFESQPSIESWLDSLATVEHFPGLRYIKVAENDDVEIYVTNRNIRDQNVYLCRVPIDARFRELYNILPGNLYLVINIKKEKINLIDSQGNMQLVKVPMTNRDRLEEVADDALSEIIKDVFIDFMKTLDFSTPEKLCDIEKRWLLSAHADNLLNDESRKFVDNLRKIKSGYRDDLSKHKNTPKITLFDAITSYDYVFWHNQCNIPYFKTLADSVGSSTMILMGKDPYHIDDTHKKITINDVQKLVPNVISADDYKKEHKLKLVRNTVSGKSIVCWSGRNGYSEPYDRIEGRLGSSFVFNSSEVFHSSSVTHTRFYTKFCDYRRGATIKIPDVYLVASKANGKFFPSIKPNIDGFDVLVKMSKVCFYNQKEKISFDDFMKNLTSGGGYSYISIVDSSWNKLLEHDFILEKLTRELKAEYIITVPRRSMHIAPYWYKSKKTNVWAIPQIIDTHHSIQIFDFLRDHPTWIAKTKQKDSNKVFRIMADLYDLKYDGNKIITYFNSVIYDSLIEAISAGNHNDYLKVIKDVAMKIDGSTLEDNHVFISRIDNVFDKHNPDLYYKIQAEKMGLKENELIFRDNGCYYAIDSDHCVEYGDQLIPVEHNGKYYLARLQEGLWYKGNNYQPAKIDGQMKIIKKLPEPQI